MASKIPLRAVFNASNVATGLAEFQSGDFIPLSHGGIGAALSIGTAGQVLKVNSGASALEFGSVEASFNIDGMTDGTSITIVDGDLLALSDGGTEKKVTASQLKTYIGGYDGDITTIDIDGGADIGEALADADLFIVDNGAGGTNRKMAASRIKTFVGASAGGFAIANLDIDGGSDIGADLATTDLIVVDDGAGGTNRKAALSRLVTLMEAQIDAIGGNLTVTGNLTVNGTTTTVATTNTVISDNLIELNNGASSNSNDSGIVIERGSTGDNAIIMWDESADQFVVATTTATGTSTGNISHTKANFEAAEIKGTLGNFTSTSAGTVLTVAGTDDGSSAGPELVIKRNSSSPADNDALGGLVFKGENDADQAVTFAKIQGNALDVSDGTEDGQIDFKVITNGSTSTVATLDSTGLFLNTNADIIFEGDGQDAHEATLTIADGLSGDVTITLPGATDTLVGKATTDTLTNKTLTSPKLNENVALTSTSTELNLLDGITAIADEDTMSSNSATALATQQSIKAYVDTEIGNISQTSILQNNSNVTVADTGTGNVTIEVDGTDRITTVAATTTTATGHSIVLGAASNSAAGSIKFLEGTDNGTNGVTLQGPASTADVTITLPAVAGTVITTANSDAPSTSTSSSDADFVLIDDGGVMKKITPANLGIVDNSGYTNSSFLEPPGSLGNFDAAKETLATGAQTGSAESGLTANALDAFDVQLAAFDAYDHMEPKFALKTTDLGSGESHVGA